MIALEIAGQILFWLVMVIAVMVVPIGIPGTFIIVANTLVYAWLTDFSELTWGFLGILVLIAVAAEVVEFFIGAAAAGKFGASRQGMLGAIVGGFLGAIWMTPVVPVLGTLLGAFVGAFVGATVLEYAGTRNWDRAMQVGFGAFLGTVGGRLTKIAVAVGMVVIVGYRLV